MAEKSKERKSGKNRSVIRRALRMGLNLVGLLLLVFLIYFSISSGYDFGYNLFAAPAMSDPPGREVTFVVSEGESTSDIVDALVEAGLIRDKLSFYCQIIFYDKILQPGEYQMNTSMTSKEILLYLNDGPDSLD